MSEVLNTWIDGNEHLKEVFDMSKHTDTPWGIGTEHRDLGQTIRDERGKVVAMAYDRTAGYEEGIANAAFIVKACNGYEQMREALEDAREWIVQAHVDFNLENEDIVNVVDLALTEGGEGEG